MKRQFEIISADTYKTDYSGFIECHTTELISSNYFVDGSEKHIFLQTDRLIILSKSPIEYGFIYTCEIKKL